jgi:hypothetical protein
MALRSNLRIVDESKNSGEGVMDAPSTFYSAFSPAHEKGR